MNTRQLYLANILAQEQLAKCIQDEQHRIFELRMGGVNTGIAEYTVQYEPIGRATDKARTWVNDIRAQIEARGYSANFSNIAARDVFHQDAFARTYHDIFQHVHTIAMLRYHLGDEGETQAQELASRLEAFGIMPEHYIHWQAHHDHVDVDVDDDDDDDDDDEDFIHLRTL